MTLTTDEKYDLITRNLQEVMGRPEDIKKILDERPLKLYWGTSPTGRIHAGYFVPMLKIADYLQAGCEVIILLADLHAILDNLKSSFELVEFRTKYYEIMIKTILTSMNIDINKLKFVRGTSFQLTPKYTMDVYRANSFIAVNKAKHAGADVVKQTDNPMMNGLLYPTLQALDEEYLNVDVQHGGSDQRKIYGHALEIMPKLGYKKRFYFMNELVSGLRASKQGDTTEIEKMSSSILDSKIDLLDTKNQIKSKINKCYCLAGDINDNCLMTILEKMLFPMLKYKGLNFTINRKEKFGGPITYTNMDDIKRDFVTEINPGEFKLHPADFKQGMFESFDLIIEPIRKVFETAELQTLIKKAYSN